MLPPNLHHSPVEITEKLGKNIAELDQDLIKGDGLVTGFPGFVAKNLLRRLLVLQPEATFYLLVQSHLLGLARRSVEELERENPGAADRLILLEGDITVESLGLGAKDYEKLTKNVRAVWHLAAIYDLAVPEQIAYQVNVGGTIRVLDFCQDCQSLERLNYISTCYVSGYREGTIYEDELDEGQGHQNHYESTKFWAEVEVRRRAEEIPTVILRPGIIVGDSRSGETDKYDGPYFLMKLIKRLPDWAPMLNIGRGDSVVNLIPIDFAADAMSFIGLKEESAGRTYQIADPNPMRARDVVAVILSAMGRAPAVAALPPKLVDAALRRETIESIVGVPHEALAYFNHDARYDTQETQAALEDTHIFCPHLSSYIQILVDYFLEHPEKGFLDERRARKKA